MCVFSVCVCVCVNFTVSSKNEGRLWNISTLIFFWLTDSPLQLNFHAVKPTKKLYFSWQIKFHKRNLLKYAYTITHYAIILHFLSVSLLLSSFSVLYTLLLSDIWFFYEAEAFPLINLQKIAKQLVNDITLSEYRHLYTELDALERWHLYLLPGSLFQFCNNSLYIHFIFFSFYTIHIFLFVRVMIVIHFLKAELQQELSRNKKAMTVLYELATHKKLQQEHLVLRFRAVLIYSYLLFSGL
jgi:hypothetical protein